MALRYEVCVETADGVRAALAAGADRVELCADLAVGGTTPSAGLIEWAVRAARGRIGVHVLVRPRGGDFVFDGDEEDVMARDIRAAKTAGADGVVIGALTPGATVDVALTARLMSLARPLSVTFHRAFDETTDPVAAFGDVLELGADRLLTSGGSATALAGSGVIRELVDRSGGKIEVMAGSGVTERTAAEIVRRTGVRELHFSARAAAPALPFADRITRIMSAAESVGSGRARLRSRCRSSTPVCAIEHSRPRARVPACPRARVQHR
jgi:copper homeostasis protein